MYTLTHTHTHTLKHTHTHTHTYKIIQSWCMIPKKSEKVGGERINMPLWSSMKQKTSTLWHAWQSHCAQPAVRKLHLNIYQPACLPWKEVNTFRVVFIQGAKMIPPPPIHPPTDTTKVRHSEMQSAALSTYTHHLHPQTPPPCAPPTPPQE